MSGPLSMFAIMSCWGHSKQTDKEHAQAMEYEISEIHQFALSLQNHQLALPTLYL